VESVFSFRDDEVGKPDRKEPRVQIRYSKPHSASLAVLARFGIRPETRREKVAQAVLAATCFAVIAVGIYVAVLAVIFCGFILADIVNNNVTDQEILRQYLKLMAIWGSPFVAGVGAIVGCARVFEKRRGFVVGRR
jgi:hypothetical protein